MSRTIRRTYKGEPVRDGQWTARCPEGHDCSWCGPAASLPYKVPARRTLEQLFDEYDVVQVRSPWSSAVYTFFDGEGFDARIPDDCSCCCCTGSCNEELSYDAEVEWEVRQAWLDLEHDTDDWFYGWGVDDALYWMGLTWNLVVMSDDACPQCGSRHEDDEDEDDLTYDVEFEAEVRPVPDCPWCRLGLPCVITA